MTVVSCACEGRPTTVRLHGRGRAVLAGTPELDAVRPRSSEERAVGRRSVVDVDRVAGSCGSSVPVRDLRCDSDVLDEAHERRDDACVEECWRARNAVGTDGRPAVERS